MTIFFLSPFLVVFSIFGTTVLYTADPYWWDCGQPHEPHTIPGVLSKIHSTTLDEVYSRIN